MVQWSLACVEDDLAHMRATLHVVLGLQRVVLVAFGDELLDVLRAAFAD